MLPFLSLYAEGRATGDAVGYLRAERPPDEEKAAYKVLYPAYGTYIGGEFGDIWEAYEAVFYLGAVIPGHVIGRWKASTVDARRAAEAGAPREEEAPAVLDTPPPTDD